MKLYVKNMVSRRCIIVVKYNLKKIGIRYSNVELGQIETIKDVSNAEINQLRVALSKSGLELIDNKKAVLIESIKTTIINLIHNSDEALKVNFSDYLSAKLGQNYTYLSNLFSESEGITIEHYIISHKIERAKELIIDGDLNITEISYKLRYSSVAHLSYQFKKITGLSPSIFKKLKSKKRKELESL